MSNFTLHRQWESPLILLAALLWIPGAGGDAFLSDDIGHLTIWGQPPFGQIWRWFYTEDFGYYRPLTALLWKIEYAIWGLQPLGYQLANFALHTGCALLVQQLGRLLFPGVNRIGFFAALIFLFLPGHIFGVLMIAALTGLLTTLCCLAAAVSYLRGRTSSKLAQALGPFFFLLALLTKELALSLPLLVGLWELLAQRAEGRFTWINWFKACLPYGLVLASYLLFRWALFGQMPYSPLHANATPLRLLVNAATYAAKSVAPWGLEDLKPFFRAHPHWLALIAGIQLALAAGALWRWHQHLTMGYLFGLAWFGVTVLPVVSLYSPWNTYLPSVGTALLLAALADWTGKAARMRQWTLAAFIVLSIAYSLDHQRQWHQARSLTAQVADAVARLEVPGPVYLANLPAEWDDVPLFIADWALRGTLRLQGRDREVIALANVIKTRSGENLETQRIDQQRFAMRLLDPDEFFRLEQMEILSGQRPLTVDYAYAKAGIPIRVAGLSALGQANALEIDMGSAERLTQVYTWDGRDLVPLP